MIEDRDEILDELRAVVNVEPSPAFEARVRQAVVEAARRPVWMPWAAAAGVAAAAVVVGVIALTTHGERADAGRTGAPAFAAMTSSPARASAASAPVAPPARAAAVALRRPIARQVRGPELRAIIPKGEARAFAQLVAAARRGDLAHVRSLSPAQPTPLATPADIDVAPIEIPPMAEED